MFSRRTIQHTVSTVLITVLFSVFWPVMGYAAGKNSAASPLHEICAVEGVKQAPQDSTGSISAAHKPCVFCTAAAPLFADSSLRTIALFGAAPQLSGILPDWALPPDHAATQPLNPRAPPRAR